METLTALEPVLVAPDTFVLPAFLPVPGLGILPMHAFVVRAADPVLVDTGPAPLAGDFVDRLAKVLDPADLRYVWLTHGDPDHVGALGPVLQAAPRAQVVTTFIGMGKLALGPEPLPSERTLVVNPGQQLDLGDRALHALRPPVFDSAETVIAFDDRSRALFCADCFGTLLDAPHDDAAAMTSAERSRGMLTWASVDTPWLEYVSAEVLFGNLQRLRRLDPQWVLGSHLPPSRGLIGSLVRELGEAAGQKPFVGPDQAAMDAMAAQ
ncbi:oxygen-binding di-iron domain-containing protein [Paraliomyxa miuraensis]|uniref:MBL fold metallo-hydrolase n=1 Tax=Paraliomyxa miuraensis TaxID=376150 RepID=UPI00225A1E5F|nr:MBL fold metallo-hydrolase [Paraliomyxa miuraensis]MCX4239694.1 MBL fold metallo-hydrolase [Paraliomyxa miuraensis]